MRIYTGYYGNMRAYQGMTCVAISLSVPKWLSAPLSNIRELNPKPWMLHMEKEQYTEAYNRILAKLSARKIIDFINTVSDGKPVVLLCFEKPCDFCHRELVAAWLNRELGLDVQEYVKPDAAESELRQMELF